MLYDILLVASLWLHKKERERERKKEIFSVWRENRHFFQQILSLTTLVLVQMTAWVCIESLRAILPALVSAWCHSVCIKLRTVSISIQTKILWIELILWIEDNGAEFDSRDSENVCLIFDFSVSMSRASYLMGKHFHAADNSTAWEFDVVMHWLLILCVSPYLI